MQAKVKASFKLTFKKIIRKVGVREIAGHHEEIRKISGTFLEIKELLKSER